MLSDLGHGRMDTGLTRGASHGQPVGLDGIVKGLDLIEQPTGFYE